MIDTPVAILEEPMLRRLPLVALAVLAVAHTASSVDLPEIKAAGTLRVLVSADEQPEAFALTPGAAAGFERDLIEGFAKSQGLKLQVVTLTTFDQLIPALVKGEGDVIVGIIETETRRKQIEFTMDTLPGRHLAVNLKPKPPIESLDELRAARIGIIPGTSWAEAVATAGVKPGNTVSFADLPQLLEALRSGKVGAIVMSTPDFAVSQRREPNLQAGTFVGPPTRAAWGVRLKDLALRDALSDFLFNTRNSQAWGQMVIKYFNVEALELFKRARRP
jgi:ABC-type amino acid transport substrate-binding protein